MILNPHSKELFKVLLIRYGKLKTKLLISEFEKNWQHPILLDFVPHLNVLYDRLEQKSPFIYYGVKCITVGRVSLCLCYFRRQFNKNRYEIFNISSDLSRIFLIG